MELKRIDPVFSTDEYLPKAAKSPLWLYARGEYEAYCLQKMKSNVKKLKLLVGYPGVFRSPSPTVWYRNLKKDAPFSINGISKVSVRGDYLYVMVTVSDPCVALPALSSKAEGWEASTDGEIFSLAEKGGEPTGTEEPTVRLELRKITFADGEVLYDVGREVMAYLTFRGDSMPHFTVGESQYEALNVSSETQEQTFAVEKQNDGTLRTSLPLAFRYVKLGDCAMVPPVVDAVFTPLVYRRVYDFCDEELNRIWEASAYTLRLCIQTFQVDGVKRDRLPWGGDLLVSLLANCYSFREAQPIKRTLTVLGRDGVKLSHCNGILDYSLWLVVSHELYQQHFDDVRFLKANWCSIEQILNWFIARAREDDGLIRPKEAVYEGSKFVSGDWCFIDWVSVPKTTALQMIFHYALLSGAKLAHRLGDEESAKYYEEEAGQLRSKIIEEAFDSEKGLFRSDIFDKASSIERHALFLSVLAGVVPEDAKESIANALMGQEIAEAGTPYMISLEILALHQLGYDEAALAKIRKVWGGMLKLGATTFFEGYEDNFDEKTMCVFYERPFGMSLCHAWSSAPCALLPMILKDGKR